MNSWLQLFYVSFIKHFKFFIWIFYHHAFLNSCCGTDILTYPNDWQLHFSFFRPQLTSRSSVITNRPYQAILARRKRPFTASELGARRRPNCPPERLNPAVAILLRPWCLSPQTAGACASWRYLLLATGFCFRPAFACPCHSPFVPAPVKCQRTCLLPASSDPIGTGPENLGADNGHR